MKRGAVQTRNSVMVAVWIPKPMLAVMDAIILLEDSDRSKFARKAIRSRIREPGLAVEDGK